MAISAGLAALCQAQGVATPDGAIRGACAKLLHALGLNRPPVALKPLCDALDVSVHWDNAPARELRGDASLASDGTGLSIRIHRRGPSGWRHSRFLVAHELIHALIIRLLRDKTLIDSLDATRSDMLELERLCDLGAYELLMPSIAFRESMVRLPLGAEVLRLLYDQYLVTTGAVASRIALLTPRGSVVRLREFARTSEEDAVWRVASCFPRYATESLRPWVPRGATMKHFLPPPDVGLLTNSTLPLSGKVDVLISGRRWHCDFTAFTLRSDHHRHTPRPIFEEFEVPDEPMARSQDTLLFLSEAVLLDMPKRVTRTLSPRKAFAL